MNGSISRVQVKKRAPEPGLTVSRQTGFLIRGAGIWGRAPWHIEFA